MRIWITRAEPEARRTAEAVVAAGHRPLISPLIQVAPLMSAADPLARALVGVGALAFTSANGVRAFAVLRPISDRHLPVYAVGEATARAAREAGFATVIGADGDVAALAKRIAAKDQRPDGVVLHPGASEPAGDLAGDLQRRGLSARFLAVYETLPQAPAHDLLMALDQDPPAVAGVLIHSPKAAVELAKVLGEHPGLAEALTVICISKAAAEPLKPFKFARRVTAAKPNEAAMLARLAL
jgi:uroporphyrinogen-III synthase